MIAGAFVASVLLFLQFDKPSSVPVNIVREQQKYYVNISVALSDNNTPLINAEMDGKTYSLMLDLGYTGCISLQDKLLCKVAPKVYIGETTKYNFKGTARQVDRYKIPRVTIGNVSWKEPVLESRSDAAAIEIRFREDGNTPTIYCDGLFGWRPFQCFNLFLDLGNSKAACCDSIETLKDRGYPVETWVRTALLTDRHLVEFEATTPEGFIRCSLDTGCTFSFLSRELPGKSITEAYFDSSTFEKYPFLIVDGTDLGPLVLRQIPNRIPIPIPLTLGMDFFMEHQVFLDFKNKLIYLSPSNSR